MKPNTNTTVESLLAKTLLMPNGCMEWQPSRDKDGYGCYMIMYKSLRAHRVMARLIYGEPEPNMVVRHSCDNPPCINPEHLSFGTQKQNVADKFTKNRANTSKGDSHCHAKLTSDLVVTLRKEYKEIRNYSELARRHGLNYETVRDAVLGLTWKHVPMSDI